MGKNGGQWQKDKKTRGGGRRGQPLWSPHGDCGCLGFPVVAVDGARWWDGVREGLWLSWHCARFSAVVSTATENNVVCLWAVLCINLCFGFFITTTCQTLLSCFCSFLSSPSPSSPPLSLHPSLLSPPSLQDVRLLRFPPELWHRMQSKPCTSLRLWRYCTLALSSTLSLYSLHSVNVEAI